MEVLKYILSSIIVVATPLIFVKILLNPPIRNDKSKIIVAISVSLISSILIYNYISEIYRSIIVVILYIFITMQTFNITIKKSIMAIITLMLLLIFLEVFFLYLMINILNLSSHYCYNVFAGSIISNLLVYSLAIILSILLKRIFKSIISFKTEYNVKIIILSVLSLISVLVLFYDISASFKLGSRIFFYVISILTFVCLLVIVVNQESKNIKLQSKYDKLLDFMEIYEIELENERILRHEYKNQLITIKSKIVDKDNSENIINYINCIIRDEINFVQEEYIKFQFLPLNGLKALLYFKVSDAKKKGIEVNVNISSSIKESFLKELAAKEFKELGMLLGIYLDNAIDASQESDKKVLGIEAYDTNDGIEFIISNSYKGKIEEDKVGNIHFSTKGKGRGYGLLLVKKILKSNSIFKCERGITGSLYVQNIIVKNKRSH